MISRAGKSTIPQHLCFNNAPGNKKEFNFSKKDGEGQEGDLGMLINDKGQKVLSKEMEQIEVTEK